MADPTQITPQTPEEFNQDAQYGLAPIPYHAHTGTDSANVDFGTLVSRVFTFSYTIQGTNAATTTNYSTFFTAAFPMTLTAISEVHAVKGTDGSAVTVTVEKLTGTTAPGGGTALLNAAIDLKGTINTVVNGVMANIARSNFNLATGDRLALVLTGTPTAVANVTITCTMNF